MVEGEGPVPCVGMVVGEAPGAQEDREGRPFVGPSGVLLNAALEEAGVQRAEVYVTNAYKIRPPGNRTPTEEELEQHAGLLHHEITGVAPLAILALGNIATGSLGGPAKGILRHHGIPFRYPWVEEQPWVYPTFHPAYVLRNRGRAEIGFYQDVKAFVEASFKLATHS